MYIFEMFPANQKFDDAEKPDLRYSPDEDKSVLKISDTRKARLTLRHIQKLRIMNELRAVEMAEKYKKIKKIYGAKAESAPVM
jgi:hypothetical protein